ncbi:MAG TPA: thioredoxin family protein, partial [Anaerolineae bacterium]|nr:thioredoxin family protein [Anaerolineae bacterium]
MPERILIAVALIGLGVLAYRLLLSAQRRRATSAAGRGRTPSAFLRLPLRLRFPLPLPFPSLRVGVGDLAGQGSGQALRGQATNDGRPALIVFTSPTCAPCKLQQMPVVDRLMAGWAERIDLRVVDVTEQPDVAARFGVWSLPTTIVLDAGGRVSALNQGVASEQKLREQFERVSGWAT